MSSNVAIRIVDLGKRYEIYDAPRDRLLQMLSRGRKQYFREFWAINNVSFEIARGQTLGVIGRNGSGKSTLLQLICGTLNPTTGSIETHGRVAALLELGAGFNPEFTGRENVYLAASLYGLTRKEIERRFDLIAKFADIGAFIEQPVKTYSSGMFVRLAFAVIAHVDADILVVDEALSVGDAVFVQKCMRFIREFQKRGTLIFVSHDITSVQNLCESGIWLNGGKIQRAGTAKEVAEAYLQYTLQEIYGEETTLTTIGSDDDLLASEQPPATMPAVDYQAVASVRENLSSAKGWKTGHAEITAVALARLSPGPDGVFEGGVRVRMTVRAKALEPVARPILGFLVRDRLGQDLFGENTLKFTDTVPTPIEAGTTFQGVFDFKLPMLPNGQYAVMASVADGDLHDNVQHHWVHDALIITVSSSKVRYGLVGIPFERVALEVVNE